MCADKLGTRVVMKVGEKFLGRGHQFYFDNFFTSVELADKLLAESTGSCGTIRMSRKGWPEQLKFKKGMKKKDKLQPGEYRMLQNGPKVATVWQDKRTIAVLSTHVQPEIGSAPRVSKKGI